MEQDRSEARLNVVTGATGQVGIELCQILVERGELVRAVVLEGDPAASRLRELGVEVVVGDACDESSLRAGFAGADTIYHLAAVISTSSKLDPRAWQVNVEGPRNACRAAIAVGARRLVYFSSIVVFDPAPFDQPLDESRPRLPVTAGAPYVRSKVCAEQIVREFAAGDLDAVIVHPTVVVGPNETHHVGAVQSLFHRYLERKLPAVFAGGFDAVAAADVAAGAIAAAERGRRGESYILGGGWHTLRQLLGHMQPHCGARLPRFALPLGLARAGLGIVGAIARIRRSQPAFTREDLRQLAGNQQIVCAKAEAELGYSANSLASAIERIYDEWRVQQAGSCD